MGRWPQPWKDIYFWSIMLSPLPLLIILPCHPSVPLPLLLSPLHPQRRTANSPQARLDICSPVLVTWAVMLLGLCIQLFTRPHHPEISPSLVSLLPGMLLLTDFTDGGPGRSSFAFLESWIYVPRRNEWSWSYWHWGMCLTHQAEPG